MAMLLQSQRPPKPLWREYGEALFVALILALVIRTFVVQAFRFLRNPWSKPCLWAITC